MKKITVLIAALLASTLSNNAQATVVTFDGLADGVVADGYDGINWNSNWIVYSESQPPYTPESSTGRVYTLAADATFNFTTPTTFSGAYFSGYSTAPVYFDLYDAGVLVGVSSTLAPSETPTFLSSGYSGLVDQVDVISSTPDFYVMDNVTFGSNGGVPEPATWAMLLVGFGMVGFAMRKRPNVTSKVAYA